MQDYLWPYFYYDYLLDTCYTEFNTELFITKDHNAVWHHICDQVWENQPCRHKN